MVGFHLEQAEAVPRNQCRSAAAAHLSKELTYSLLQEDVKATVPGAASLL